MTHHHRVLRRDGRQQSVVVVRGRGWRRQYPPRPIKHGHPSWGFEAYSGSMELHLVVGITYNPPGSMRHLRKYSALWGIIGLSL